MAINAKDKFINTICKNIGIGHNIINITNIRKLDGIEEIDAIYGKLTNNKLNVAKRNYDYIKNISKIISMYGIEHTCDNGLIILDIQIEYNENGKVNTTNQIMLTKSYEELPLVLISIDYGKRAIQQLFSKLNLGDDIFKEEDRIIEIQNVNVCINGTSYGDYQTLTNLKNNLLMAEICTPIKHIRLGEEKEESELLKFCCNNSKHIEIIYDNNEPMYAQFTNHSFVETFDYNPKKDAKKIEDEFNELIDAIADEIFKIISSQNNKSNEYVKK